MNRFKLLYALLLCLVLLMSTASLLAQDDHGEVHEPRPETIMTSPIELNPAAGAEVGFVYEAFLSPHQESGEEEDTPVLIPSQFRSTTQSFPRNERDSMGHAAIQFSNDLSRAYVFLAIENVEMDQLVMLHLHCGRPGQLGPIIVDFSMAGDLHTYLEDGVMAVEITNADIEAVLAESSGVIGAFTAGCAIADTNPGDKVKTIGGLEQIARRGELYFNLHTSGQVYFGDMRGQFQLVTSP
jgi:hypothetical protein